MMLPCFFSLLGGNISAAECAGPDCTQSLGHWPALNLYLDMSFERDGGLLLEPSAKCHGTSAHINTTAAVRMLPSPDDSPEYYATASLFK